MAVALSARVDEGLVVMAEVKRLVEAVGLDFARDGHKRPTELSGGMARRASLALQLAQRKQCIVLDEPFTGLDPSAAKAVAKELRRLRSEHGTALLLVSHEPDVVALVMDEMAGAATFSSGRNLVVTLEPRSKEHRGAGGTCGP